MIIGGNSQVGRSNESNNSQRQPNKGVIVPTKNVPIFDSFFGIRVTEPRLSVDMFNTYCNGIRKIKLGSLNSNSSTNESIIMAVIVESTGIKKSAAKKDYMIWQLSDLICDKVKLVMFGEATQAHWKLQPGFVVAITNAEVGSDSVVPSSSLEKSVTLKVNKSIQIMSIGFCPDFSTCIGQKKNGDRCTNYVNIAVSPVCVYHLQSEAKKLRSNRSNFSSSKLRQQKPPANTGLFTVNQSNVRNFNTNFASRSSVVAKSSIESKCLKNLGDALDKENTKTQSIFLSQHKNEPMSSLIHQSIFPVFSGPRKVEPKPQFSQAEQNARARAAEIFKRSQNVDPNVRKRKMNELNVIEKRPTLSTNKCKFTNDQIRKLLEKKSHHEVEAEQADREQELKYFQKKEVEEKIESHATTLLELKDVNVVTCKTCNYTTVNLAQRCIELNHQYVLHKARKRFFKCKDCHTRTICYTLMPTQPCTKCSSREFVRVAMKDERNIKLRENLQVRGEERTFVNI